MTEAGDFWVGDRLVRPSLGEIRLGLERVHLEPRSVSVLVALAARPREVIPKRELIEEVWGEAFVSDEVLTHAIWDLRRAFGDNATRPEFIQTVPKRGYRLIAPVRAVEAKKPSHPPGEARKTGRRYRWLGLVILVVLLVAFWVSRTGPNRLLPENLAAHSEVNNSELSRDPDITPFFSILRHDVRAVRDFLLGVRYVYRNEMGGAEAFDSAIAIDPDFVGPWIWRAPGVIAKGDLEEVVALELALDRLYGPANGFEKAMISWVGALLAGSPADEVRQLRIALAEEPGNRPVQLNLAGAYLRLGDDDSALGVLEPLLVEPWCFPSLFTLTAEIAFDRGSIDEAEPALEAALGCSSVDPEILSLLRLLAVYRDDPKTAAEYGDRLLKREREMFPEIFDFDATRYAEQLAAEAEEEGRPETARRLREFAD